ncbi:MAG TPA: glycosyltransferase family 4 protein, partial [Caldithrix sp.]|nr:glycosyltransferase family 4 protein [Caldithrix sp.]
DNGVEVTLFATADSITKAKLHSVCPKGYAEDEEVDPKVWECLHISEVFEHAHEFDLIHNHFDFLPLSYSKLVKTPLLTTIHGFSSPKILPVYKKYNQSVHYISISDADRSPKLDYLATIHHGINLEQFTFNPAPEEYLLFFGRIHTDKGAYEAIQIAKKSKKRLIIAGIIQDGIYFKEKVKPYLNEDDIIYLGSANPKQRDRLMGNAFALLHPINFSEPFGLSVVESFACGTPVIAFNKGSMPEIISDGKNGFLVSTIDEAVSAVKNMSRLDRSFCRKDAEQRFSSKRMVNDYIDAYRKILNK